MVHTDSVQFLKQVCDDFAATLPPAARYAFTLVASAHLARIEAPPIPGPEPPRED